MHTVVVHFTKTYALQVVHGDFSVKKFLLKTYKKTYIIIRYENYIASGCSADGSVLGSGPRGHGFESRHSDHNKTDRFCGLFYYVRIIKGFEPERARA